MKREKDYMVEILRIIAAFMVIGTHVKLGNYATDMPSKSRILISCFVGDGVAIFFSILGFFYLKKSYTSSIKHLIKKVLIPLYSITLFLFYFYDYILGIDSTIKDSLYHPKDEYKFFFRESILKWQNYVRGGDHLWYLYVYSLVVFMYPMVKGIIDFAEERKNGDVYLLAILYIGFAYNDLLLNDFYRFSHTTFHGALAGIFFVVLGHVLYKHKDVYKGNIKYGLFGLIAFILNNIIRAVIQYYCYITQQNSEEPLFWFTGYGMITVISLFVFVYGCFGNINYKNCATKIISHISSKTYMIYIIHLLVLDYLNAKGIRDRVICKFSRGGVRSTYV